MFKLFKVTVEISSETGKNHYVYAVNKEHAEIIVINHYRLLGNDFFLVEAEEVE